mmetsp:Transcript_21816/g.36090  ORF Transcript_21816/g.36090 Transcript_21816/m.36090 type:complete len:142 (+) Transcript_21816:1000-1425(+)
MGGIIFSPLCKQPGAGHISNTTLPLKSLRLETNLMSEPSRVGLLLPSPKVCPQLQPVHFYCNEPSLLKMNGWIDTHQTFCLFAFICFHSSSACATRCNLFKTRLDWQEKPVAPSPARVQLQINVMSVQDMLTGARHLNNTM